MFGDPKLFARFCLLAFSIVRRFMPNDGTSGNVHSSGYSLSLGFAVSAWSKAAQINILLLFHAYFPIITKIGAFLVSSRSLKGDVTRDDF